MVENKKFFVCYLLALALSVGCNIAQRNLMSGGMDMGISLSIRLTKKLKTVYKEVYDKKIKDVETSIGHADCITHNGTSEHIGAKAKVVRSLSSQKKIYEAMSELYPTILKYIYILLDLEKRKNKVFEHQTLDQQNESQTQLKLPHAAYLDMHIKKVHEKLEDLHAPFVNLQLELSGLQFGELQLALDTLQPHLGELQFDLDKLKRELGGLQLELSKLQRELGELQFDLDKLKRELGGLQLELSKLQRQLNKANEAYSFKLLHWLWFKIIQPICSRR